MSWKIPSHKETGMKMLKTKPPIVMNALEKNWSKAGNN